MNWRDLLIMVTTSLGMDILAVKAGLIGGFLSLTYEKKRTPWQAGVSILSGAVLAGYLGPIAVHYFSLHEGTAAGASFLIGLLSMRIIPGLFRLAGTVAKNPLEYITHKKTTQNGEEQ